MSLTSLYSFDRSKGLYLQ